MSGRDIQSLGQDLLHDNEPGPADLDPQQHALDSAIRRRTL